MKNRHSLVPERARQISKGKLSGFQEFGVWKGVCDQLLAKPFPSQSPSPGFSADEIERDSRVTFEKLSNWEIACQEILDTKHSQLYYQKCHDELRRRGKSEQEILEMRRCAWYTAGWLNYPMMVWDGVSLDTEDILRAIEWLYDRKQISQEQRLEFENFVRLHE